MDPNRKIQMENIGCIQPDPNTQPCHGVNHMNPTGSWSTTLSWCESYGSDLIWIRNPAMEWIIWIQPDPDPQPCHGVNHMDPTGFGSTTLSWSESHWSDQIRIRIPVMEIIVLIRPDPNPQLCRGVNRMDLTGSGSATLLWNESYGSGRIRIRQRNHGRRERRWAGSAKSSTQQDIPTSQWRRLSYVCTLFKIISAKIQYKMGTILNFKSLSNWQLTFLAQIQKFFDSVHSPHPPEDWGLEVVGIALAISPYTHTEGYNILAQKYVQPGGARGLAQRAAQRAPRHETSFKYPAPPSPIKYNRQTVKETSIVGDRLFKHTRTCQGDKTSTRYHISYTTQRLNEGVS